MSDSQGCPEMVSLDTPALAAAFQTFVGDRQFSHGKLLVEDLALIAGERALDVGCGSGRLAAYVADIVGRDGIVHRIDPLPLRVEIAQRIERSNLKVAVGRAEDSSGLPPGVSTPSISTASSLDLRSETGASRVPSRVGTGGQVGVSGPSKERLHDLDVIVAQALVAVAVGLRQLSAPHKIDQQELTELSRAPVSASR